MWKNEISSSYPEVFIEGRGVWTLTNIHMYINIDIDIDIQLFTGEKNAFLRRQNNYDFIRRPVTK